MGLIWEVRQISSSHVVELRLRAGDGLPQVWRYAVWRSRHKLQYGLDLISISVPTHWRSPALILPTEHVLGRTAGDKSGLLLNRVKERGSQPKRVRVVGYVTTISERRDQS
ncbi:hypothetical protein COCVIDRAFT_84397 [Bipolaris victoriae FI3]|uniref:Uncharacterized protein n=2 Tax=Bipolaris TaxID=33194 RepID=W6Y5Z6_COCC2|nr:uncharacterized protein COCCADRAFT_96982 [Bipolaris zeicola 26-R-13]XP_014562396.1 hypothetical protein COCVIDRAFT_84397 [Bipolaris victoriae FI3]EUC33110.1 hypothetical protein COCCADRAFT_96982 [Bipolaris zeicola 26-R-13]